MLHTKLEGSRKRAVKLGTFRFETYMRGFDNRNEKSVRLDSLLSVLVRRVCDGFTPSGVRKALKLSHLAIAPCHR